MESAQNGGRWERLGVLQVDRGTPDFSYSDMPSEPLLDTRGAFRPSPELESHFLQPGHKFKAYQLWLHTFKPQVLLSLNEGQTAGQRSAGPLCSVV